MAYLIEIASPCAVCDKPATVRVFNNQNARMADYCKRHGEARAKELSRIEANRAGKRSPQSSHPTPAES